MNRKDKEDIKKVLQYLKTARKSDRVTFHSMVEDDEFKREIFTTLERISGWNSRDEEKVLQLASQYRAESEGKTPSERSAIIKKIIKGSCITLGIGLAGGLAFHLFSKKKTAGK